MTDEIDTGHSPEAESEAGPVPGAEAEVSRAPGPTSDPEVGPTVLVFDDLDSLVDSLLVPEPDQPVDGPSPGQGAPGTGRPIATPVTGDGEPRFEVAEPVLIPSIETDDAVAEVITDEERTRYGLLLDRAAERGLLEPADYEVRLRALAEATTTEQMVDIVAELPAFTPPPISASRAHSRRAGRSVSVSGPRPGRAQGERRRMALWALLVLLVIVAMASLVILALSVDRLSKNRGSMGPAAPVATRPFSVLRL